MKLFALVCVMVECLSPSPCWECGTILSKDGVTSQRLVWSYDDALNYYHGNVFSLKRHERSLPCGKCAACLIRKRKDMSTRLSHEASCHESCIFLTLTYDEQHVPVGSDGHKTLCVTDVQLFMKRLRRYLEYYPKKSVRDHANNIRYFAVGEYGSNTHRPHYHIMIFGWSPSDSKFFYQKGNIIHYRSGQIERLWKYGHSEFSAVSPYVARYCSRYVTKKITSKWTPFADQLPEFTLSSKRNGGIGALWCDKYGIDALRRRFCTYRCDDKIFKASVPRYYYNRIRKRNLPLWLNIRDERIEWIKSHPSKCSDNDFSDLVRVCEVYEYNEKLRRVNETL